MSMYVTVNVQFKDVPALQAALLDLCPQWKDHLRWRDTPEHLHGYHGDERQEVANLIIPRSAIGSASNDLGFIRDENGQITAIISEYDQRSGGYGQPWIVSLKKYYAFRLVERQQKARGRTVRMARCAASGRDQLIVEGIR